MLWSLFFSCINVLIVDFGGMVFIKKKKTKVIFTCNHVWLFTPPHILVKSVAGTTPKFIGTFTKANLLSAITFSLAVNVNGAGGRLPFGNLNLKENGNLPECSN